MLPVIYPNNENSLRSSYEVDFSNEIDTIEDALKESINRWHGDIPRTRQDFEITCLVIIKDAIASQLGDNADLDKLIDEYAREHGTYLHDSFIKVLIGIISSRNPQQTADIVAYAIGLRARQGISITDLAAKYCISKQAFSKQVVAFCEDNGLPPCRAMKSELAREMYKLTNRRNGKCPN